MDYTSRKSFGFTIVELLIVVVVIAILAAIVIVSYSGITNSAHAAAVKSNHSSIIKKLEMHFINKGSYPASITDCPSPAEGNLCISGDFDIRYKSYMPGSSHSTSYLTVLQGHSYELTVMGDKKFIYSSNLDVTRMAGVINREFLQYTDLAEIFDRYGSKPYRISFDIKTESPTGTNINMYMQNGSNTRHGIGLIGVPVTTSFERRTYTITPTISNSSLTASMLAFFGGAYGNGNVPVVRNLSLELAE